MINVWAIPLFYHEDDYCQIEILPRATLGYCVDEFEKIAAFANDHQAAIGFKDLYIRADYPVDLNSLSIPADDLRRILASQLNPAERVQTGRWRRRTECPHTEGYGDQYFAVFFDQQDGTVTHIWLQMTYKRYRGEALVRLLSALRQAWDVILVDWSTGAILDPDHTGTTYHYPSDMKRGMTHAIKPTTPPGRLISTPGRINWRAGFRMIRRPFWSPTRRRR
ncbi:MAG TPA: hypothetical protein VNT01_17525 [Symbiobacteriaceae bacterium]|nr:hypothetical protein [Symbiobacteriaceae bacterium]